MTLRLCTLLAGRSSSVCLLRRITAFDQDRTQATQPELFQRIAYSNPGSLVTNGDRQNTKISARRLIRADIQYGTDHECANTVTIQRECGWPGPENP